MYRLTATDAVLRLADGGYIPADPANADRQAYLAWLAAGNTPQPAPAPTAEQIQADYTARIQRRLDAFARTRGYDGILSAASYVTSTNAQFAKQGQYCVGARDATWAKGYEVMGAVQAGTRPMPSWAELEAELPALAWPA